jgi:hypothetical protein
MQFCNCRIFMTVSYPFSLNTSKETVQNSGPFPWFPNIPMLSGFLILDCQMIRPFFSDFHINKVGREDFFDGGNDSLSKQIC